MNVVTLKPIIKRIIEKSNKTILTKVLSNGTDLSVTDLETYVTIKNVGLPVGLLDLRALGITNSVSDLDINAYPLFPIVDSNNHLSVSIEYLELLLESASKDETRIYLNSVCWDGSNLVSADGYILTLIEGKNNNELGQSILPRSSLRELVQLSKKFKLKEVIINVDLEFFKVDTDHFTLIGRVIKREYLKYQTVIPAKTKHSMIIDRPVKLSTVKDILDHSNAIRLETVDGVTNLAVNGTDFKSEVGSSDFNGTIGFNLKYLEFLTNLNSNLKFNSELSPVRVSRDNITRVAMPLKV